MAGVGPFGGAAAALPQYPALCVQEREMARLFVNQFYATFDGNRNALMNMYRDVSTVGFEGDTVRGGAAFVQKLAGMGLPPTLAHRVVTVDAQPSVVGGNAVLVFVTGEYAGNQFGEVFQLVPDGQSIYVHNDIFRVGGTNAFNVPPDAAQVTKGFIEFYYRTFDTQRGGLMGLYKPHSYFTYEEQTRQGPEAIAARLQELPRVEHDPTSIVVDVHQINGNQLLLIFINGRLRVEDSEHALFFSETFILVQDGNGYYVGNHIFKLKYG